MPKRQYLFNDILKKKIPVFLPQKVKQMPTARFVEVLFLCLIKGCTIWSNIYRVTDEKPLTLYLTYSSSDLNK
jgi:hypothetical protein